MTEPTAWSPAPLEPEDRQYAEAHGTATALAAGAVSTGALPGPRPPGRSRSWLWVLLGILLVAALCVAAWMFFFRTTPAVGSDEAVADLSSQPEEAWSYRYAPRGEEEWISTTPIVRPVGGDQIAVLSSVDAGHFAAEYDSSWYEGYDAHYTAGYADGLRYREAYDAYQDNWSTPYPEPADYFSVTGATYDDYQSSSAYDGWGHGFSDGYDGMAEGTSRVARPEDPPTMGQLTVLDTGSGAEAWTLDLAGLDLDPATSTPILLPATPEGHLVLATWTYVEDTSTMLLWAIDPSDGSVVSETALEDATVADSSGAVAPLVVMIDDDVVRLDSSDLGGDYLWSASIPGVHRASLPAVADNLVLLSTDDGDWWLDAATGFEPPWFEDSDPEVTYRLVDGVVLRLEASSFGSYVDALDRDGKTLWTGDADRVFVARGSGGDVLLRGENSDEGRVEYLMRLDPRTGEPQWDTEYDGSLDWVRGTVPGGLVVDDGDRSVVLDLGSGERQQRLRGSATYLGTGVAYGSEEDRLRAWDVGDGSELWSLRLSDSEVITSVGTRLMVHDTERRELALLQ